MNGRLRRGSSASRLLLASWRPLLLGALAMAGVAALTLMLAGQVGVALVRLPQFEPGLWLPIVVALVARSTLAFAGSALLGQAATEFSTSLRRALLQRALGAPIAFHDARYSANLVSVFVADVGMVQELLRVVLPAVAQHLPTVVAGWVLVLLIDWRLALGLAAAGAPLVVGVSITGRAIRRATLQGQQTMGQLAVVAGESVTGARALKALGGDRIILERFARLTCELDRWRRRRTLLNALLDSLAPAGVLLLIVIGGLLVQVELASGRLKAEDLIIFASFAAVLGASLYATVRAYAGLEPVLGAYRRIAILLDAAEDEPTDGLPFHRGPGRLRLDGVSFRYATGGGVRDVSLTIEPGEVVAIVGPNGAGKSTLVNLLLRFYTPDRGRILLDDQPADEVALPAWRRQFALVTRDPVVFAVSVAENIALGRAGATEPEIRAAAEAMQLGPVLERLPGGLAAEVGENGVRLSSGQRQRLVLARALLQDPLVVIFDEATASLDRESEAALREAAARWVGRRTLILISHGSLEGWPVSRVVRMENGTIVSDERIGEPVSL